MSILQTIGQIAQELDVAPHRVKYIVDSRGLAFGMRTGPRGTRLFGRGVVVKIRRELKKIANRRLAGRREHPRRAG